MSHGSPTCEANPLQAVFARALGRGRVPGMGSFELTRRCNLACPHCYLGDDRGGEELSTRDVLRILEEMAGAGTLMLTLTGGEPMLRADFPEIYRRAHGLGFLVTVFTNGFLLDARARALFAEAPPRAIEVSLYGVGDEDYGHVGAQLPFAQLQTNVREALEAGLPVLLKTVTTRTLGPRLPALRAFAEALGCPFTFSTFVFDAIDGTPRAAHERLDPGCAARLEVEHARTELEHLFDPARAREQRQVPCGAGRVSFNIDPKGLLSRCAMLAALDGVRADLRQRSFLEGWNLLGEGLDEPLPEGHACRGCAVADLCNRCPAVANGPRRSALCLHAQARADRLAQRGEC